MRATGWVLVIATFFITAPVTALVVGAVQAKTSCETDLHRDDVSVPRDGAIVLHIKNENVKTFYNVCVLDSTGANWGRYEFSLGSNDERKLSWSLPSEKFEYRVGFGGLTVGGAEHSITKVDLAGCAGHRHEAVFTTTSDLTGSKATVTPIRCDPANQSDFASIQEQAVFTPPAGPGQTTTFLVVGVGLAVAFVAWAARRDVPWIPAIVGLFTRLTQPEVLQQRARAQIRELVSADPGIHVQAIAERLEMARNVVNYHLTVLCRANVLSRVRLPRQNCYFVRGEYTPNRMSQIAVLRSKRLSQAFQVIRERSGLSLTELGRALGVGHGRASKIAKRLIEIGLVKKTTANRRALFYPTG